LPAAFCGIVGLRPTSGTIDEEGFWPPSVGTLALLNAVGPLARRVEDVALAYDVLRGAEPQPPDPALLAGASFASWSDDGLLPSSRAVQRGVRAAAQALEAAGMRSVAGSPAGRRLALLGWTACLGETERHAVAKGFGGGASWSPYTELARALCGRGRVTPEALYYWLGAHLGSLLNELVLHIDGARWGAAVREQLLELVGEDGVALCPVYPTTAPPHGYSYLALLATLSEQVWVNLAGLPALALPVGFSGCGMPVAVQLVGAPGSEARLLAAGMAVQRALMPRWAGPALRRANGNPLWSV
jgi:fatty acid amide hydrolase 2